MPRFLPNDCYQVMSQNRDNKRKHGGHPQKPPGTRNNSPEELAAINETVVALSKKYDEANEKNPGRDRWKFRIEIFTSVGIGIYTIITGGLLIASLLQLKSSSDAVTQAQRQVTEAGRQAKAAEDQVNISKDTEHHQLRAYLHPVIDRSDVDINKNPLEWKYVLKNFGATPACHVRTSGQIFPGPIEYGLGKKPDVINHWGIEPKYCIAPQEEHTITLHMSPGNNSPALTGDQKELIKWGVTLLLYAHGSIYYDDIFGAPHVTDFRTYFGGNETLSSGKMDWSPEGNAAR
jgi:hypothetical protein